jgi:hypothetical protein
MQGRLPISRIRKIEVFRGISQYDGYKIHTFDGGYINVKMYNQQNCCENWSISSVIRDDQLDQLQGDTITDIKIAESSTEDDDKYHGRDTYTLKVTITTDQSVFEIVMMNDHNGYYSHECIINYDIMLPNKGNYKKSIIKRI